MFRRGKKLKVSKLKRYEKKNRTLQRNLNKLIQKITEAKANKNKKKLPSKKRKEI